MRVVALLLAMVGCQSDRSPPQPAVAPIKPVDAAPPADAAPALPACSDGGDRFLGASLTRSDVRFCLEEHARTTCWAFAIPGGAMHPIAALASADPGALAVPPEDHTPAAEPWSTKVTDGAIEVCGPSGCAPFAAVPGTPPDADGAGVDDAAVNATGTLVAVARGMPGLARMSVDLYDRASGKRLGVAHPRTSCVFVEGFAGDTAVLQEWDCANQGGNQLLVAPTGKQLARIGRFYSPRDSFAQIEGTRWAFAGRGDGSIEIYDVATGARLGGRALDQFAFVTTGLGRAYAFELAKGRVSVFGADGAQLAQARIPPCRYEWETEAIGPLHLLMTVAEAGKALGPAVRKSPPDRDAMYASTWTYASGVALEIHPNFVSDATGKPVPPYLVVGISIRAPSKLRVRGIGIGSTAAEIERELGSHKVASSADRFVAGNGGESDGIVFELADGKVARIAMGELRE